MKSLKQLYLAMTEFSWVVGLMDYDEDLVLNPDAKPVVRWVSKNTDSWFADPFILSVKGDKIDILVEEYEYNRHKGRISKITVEKGSGRLCSVKPVLDGPLHFSFPFWFEENGKIYICPENVRSGKLQLYEYNPGTDECTFVRTLNPNPLADAIFIELEGKKYILATRYPDDNGQTLELFPFFERECPSKVQPIQSIVFKDKSARNGGRLFNIGGNIFRPAQSCNHFYGEGLVFQEMTSDGGELSFKEIKRISSPCRKYPLSFHTFNVFEDSIVAVDAQGFRYGWLGLILYRIREFFRR